MKNIFITLVICLLFVGCGRPPWCAPGMITDSRLNEMDLPFCIGDEVFIKQGPRKGIVGEVIGVDGFTGEVVYTVLLMRNQSGPVILGTVEVTAKSLSKMMHNANPWRPKPQEETWWNSKW